MAAQKDYPWAWTRSPGMIFCYIVGAFVIALWIWNPNRLRGVEASPLPEVTFKELSKVAALVASAQSEWEGVFGQTDNNEVEEPVWSLTGLNVTVDFRTIPGQQDADAPMLIYFEREDEHSPPKHWYAQNNYWIPTLADLDRIAGIFGLHRIKGDSSTGKCIWTRPDGALVASQDVGVFEICTPLYLARGDSSELKQYLRRNP